MILYRKVIRGILIEDCDPHFKPQGITGNWKYEEDFNSEIEKEKLFKKVENSPWFSYREQEKFVKIGEFNNV